MATQLVLRAFLADPAEELYGTEIGDAAGLMSGTVHPILARLEGVGWVDSRWEDVDPQLAGRPARRYYHPHRGGCASCPSRAGARPATPAGPTGAPAGAGPAMTWAARAPGVSATARVTSSAATTTLPSGATRERYRREHLGELSALPRTDQIHYAVGALATSWPSLRRALDMEKRIWRRSRSRSPGPCCAGSTFTTAGHSSTTPAVRSTADAACAVRTKPGTLALPPYYVSF